MNDDTMLKIIKVGMVALIPLGIMAAPVGLLVAASSAWGLFELRRQGF